MTSYEPVRKIKTQSRSVRGFMPDIGHYESTLERDFMEILKFDTSVLKVHPQPLIIHYNDSFGKDRKYTPDGLVFFKENCSSPLLYEIKYREDLRKHRKELFPKFRAAKNYAITNGWRFEVFTEKYIRTAYLNNVKFLSRYTKAPATTQTINLILNILEDLNEVAVAHLLCALCTSKEEQANILPYIWHLVANRKIQCDLNTPINMNTILWRGYSNETA